MAMGGNVVERTDEPIMGWRSWNLSDDASAPRLLPAGSGVDDAWQHRPEPPMIAPPSDPDPTQAAKRVLVVEDEEVVRGLVRQMLAGQGYEVLVAQDGEEAIELAGRNTIDVLLTDLTMPKVGGREVAERLRESQPALKVVYMSGYAEDLPTGALPPATSFLGKPFTFAELTETVRALIASP